MRRTPKPDDWYVIALTTNKGRTVTGYAVCTSDGQEVKRFKVGRGGKGWSAANEYRDAHNSDAADWRQGGHGG